MTPERAKELLPVIQAYAEGKKLDYLSPSRHEWEDDPIPNFEASGKWRVKPEPREWWLCLRCIFIASYDAQKCSRCESPLVHVREVLP